MIKGFFYLTIKLLIQENQIYLSVWKFAARLTYYQIIKILFPYLFVEHIIYEPNIHQRIKKSHRRSGYAQRLALQRAFKRKIV